MKNFIRGYSFVIGKITFGKRADIVRDVVFNEKGLNEFYKGVLRENKFVVGVVKDFGKIPVSEEINKVVR